MPVEAGRGDRNGRATNVDGRSQRTRRYGEVLVGEPPPGDCENDCAGYRHSFMSRITGDLLTSGYRPDSGCERIARVTADLAASWQKALRARVPHARVVFDRFHVERLASDAVDEIRRAEQRRVGAKAAKALKGTRFCLLKHPARLKPGEKRRLETLRRQNRALESRSRPRLSVEGVPGDHPGAGHTRRGVRLARRVAGVGDAVPPGAVRQAGADGSASTPPASWPTSTPG